MNPDCGGNFFAEPAVWMDEKGLVSWWNPERLTRVLENLLANAVKYSSPSPAVEMRLEHDVSPACEQDVLSVSVQGIDIPATDLPHIFERFRHGDIVAGRFTGTGIGLWGRQRRVSAKLLLTNHPPPRLERVPSATIRSLQK